MVDVNGAFFIRAIVRSSDRDVIVPIKVDIAKSSNRKTESRFRHFSAVEDIETTERVARPARLVIDVNSSGFVFAFRVRVVGVQGGTDDHIMTLVTIYIGDSDAVSEISAELLASYVGDVR